jgi:hypothetical protein
VPNLWRCGWWRSPCAVCSARWWKCLMNEEYNVCAFCWLMGLLLKTWSWFSYLSGWKTFYDRTT